MKEERKRNIINKMDETRRKDKEQKLIPLINGRQKENRRNYSERNKL